ncbi:MAG: hypothetical protein KF869_02945 [Phycisphaeraceae bacterium]|nr:hypothetical protein [Phycisphaeraceae bacterium]
MAFARKSVFSATVAAAALLATSAGALGSVSQFCFVLNASATVDGVPVSYSLQIDSQNMYSFSNENGDLVYGWLMDSPFELRSAPTATHPNGVVLGTLQHAFVETIADPVVSLNFAVQAGAVMTSFSATSTILSFASIVNGIGTASAGLTADDTGSDGVSLGLGSRPGMYVAKFNNSGIPFSDLDGTTFADLHTSAMFDPVGINVSADTGPFQLIPGSVFNMQSGFDFTLSAGDIASGVSTFVIIPAPGAATLLGIGGLLAMRRRR